MNKQEAYQLLGIEKGDTPKDIRRKYHQLMHKYHPDVTDQTQKKSSASNSQNENMNKQEMATRLNEAFAVLKRAGFSSPKENLWDWGLHENSKAFCKRHVYMEDQLFGDEITIDTGGAGKYYWEPDLESFPMFLKSVGKAVNNLLEQIHEEFVSRNGEAALERIYDLEEIRMKAKAKLLHLLIQEFVDPLEVIKELYPYTENTAEHTYHFSIKCVLRFAKADFTMEQDQAGDEVVFEVRPSFSRLFAVYKDQAVGQIQFEEDVLYYLVNPLLTQNVATAEFAGTDQNQSRNRRIPYQKGRLELNVRYRDKVDMTKMINKEITNTLEKYRKYLENQTDIC